MRRALREYIVAGIKTTVPFFEWLLAQPAFADGAFHTTYLDELLRSRNGRPFVEPTPQLEEMAAVAAAIETALSASAVGGGATPLPPQNGRNGSFGGWRAQARVEGVRGL